MMKSCLKAAALGIGLWAASVSSQAAALDGAQVVKSLKLADVTAMVNELGLTGFKPNSAGNAIIGEYKGTAIGLFLGECQGDSCSGLTIEAAYGKQQLSPKFLLAFNKHYLPRLIAHEDGKVFLWMPVQFAEGVTVNYLKYMVLLTLDASEKAQTYQVD